MIVRGVRKRCFSGIQPTGQLHIGNYLGAIKSWAEFQDRFDCIFGIVDLHAITEPYKPGDMPERVFETALDLLAAGLDPEKSTLIIQSLIPEHTELAWLLGSVTPVSWVQRVPAYKEKAAQLHMPVNMGLFGYPVLMTADIALYKSEIVPVGEDQLSHLELAREIIRAFNGRFEDTFPEPQAYLGGGARVMSLTEPERKMSKSLGPHNYIALADPPETVRKKMMKAVTATKTAEGEMPQGVKNLFQLLNLFSSPDTYEQFLRLYGDGSIRYSDMKRILADDINRALEPLRERRRELAARPEYVRDVFLEGSLHAREIARETIKEVKAKMGLASFA